MNPRTVIVTGVVGLAVMALVLWNKHRPKSVEGSTPSYVTNGAVYVPNSIFVAPKSEHDWPWIVSNAWIVGFKAGSEATIKPHSQYLIWCLQNGGKANREKALEFLNIVDAQMTNNPFTSENATRFGH